MSVGETHLDVLFCLFFTMHESANSCVCPCEGEGALALYNS